jgi:hypothetical protein
LKRFSSIGPTKPFIVLLFTKPCKRYKEHMRLFLI